jgi:ribosomal protein S18 acetylase RimI-like enzyme
VSPPDTSGASGGAAVRELRWSDFDAIREAYWLLYAERESDPGIGIHLFSTPPSYADEVGWFTNLFRAVLAGDAVVSVAERDGVAVGHCTVQRVGPRPDSETGHVGLLGVLVHRDHRGHGVGRALLAHALAQCEGRFDNVRLSVFATNTRARKLYEEFGFVHVGTYPRGILRGDRYIDEILMVKPLAHPPNR